LDYWELGVVVTADQARTLIAGRFSGAQVDGTSPIVISVPVDAWVPFAHFVRIELGCRFF
jgi:hypothetical protein